MEDTQGLTSTAAEPQTTGAAAPPAAPATAVTATTEAPKTYVNPDGTFTENWHDMLPEDIRYEPSLKTFKTVADVAKQAAYLKRQFGKDKIVLPNERSLPEEWAAFYNAAGRPASKDEYQYSPSEEIKPYVDPNLVGIAKDKFHKAGLTQKQAAEIFAFNEELTKIALEQEAKQLEEERVSCINSLKDKWGDNYEARLHIANRIIAENVPDDEEREQLLSIIGNSPATADFLATIGSNFMEHRPILESNVDAPYELQTKINELMQTDAYMNANNLDHKNIVNKVQALFVQKAAMKK